MKLRIQYSKIGDISYISHLDIVRLMERISRRSKVRLKYSQGFSPHPTTSFSSALPLGLESLCEYIDIETENEYDINEIIKLYNINTVQGIKFIKGRILEDKEVSVSALITNTIYNLMFYKDENVLEQLKSIVDKISNEKEIIVNKVSKRGNIQEIDIRPMIFKIKVIENKDAIFLVVDLKSSSSENLNPKMLLSYIFENTQIKEDSFYKIKKLNCYAKLDNGDFIKPI